MLSYVCSQEGRRPTKAKLKKIKDWKPCTNLTEARGFCGLCVFFRKWIKGFMSIMASIYQLNRKDVRFVWGKEQQAAMDKIKDCFTEDLLLVKPDYTPGASMLIVVCDGGPHGWGATLHQCDSEGVQKTIEFESGFFNETEQRYDQLKKEALALCKVLKKFKYYVHGRRFRVETDAATLIWLLNQIPLDLPNAVMTRWLTWL